VNSHRGTKRGLTICARGKASEKEKRFPICAGGTAEVLLKEKRGKATEETTVSEEEGGNRTREDGVICTYLSDSTIYGNRDKRKVFII